jgi:hypothetical protein
VDVLAGAVRAGSTVGQAAGLLEPEPDAPLFTPRIALVLDDAVWLVAIQRGASGTARRVIEAESEPATVTVLSTYSGTVSQPEGTAPMMTTSETRPLIEVAEAIWDALDPTYRVALVAGRHRDPQPSFILPATR